MHVYVCKIVMIGQHRNAKLATHNAKTGLEFLHE